MPKTRGVVRRNVSVVATSEHPHPNAGTTTDTPNKRRHKGTTHGQGNARGTDATQGHIPLKYYNYMAHRENLIVAISIKGIYSAIVAAQS